MRKILFALLICIQSVMFKTASAEDWFILNTPAIQWVNTVNFVNQSTGFLTAGFQIYKTTNEGASWLLSANTTYQSFYAQFLNENTGFTYGIYKIQSTTNGGSSWSSLTLDTSLRAVYFADEVTWYTSTINNAIKKTTDKGNAWQYLNAGLPVQYAYRTIHFINSTTGFIAGDNGGGVSALGLIRKTTNGGATWQTRASVTGIAPNSFTFLNSSTGYLCGGYKIYKTTDAGDSWVEYVMPNNRDIFYSISFGNETTGFAAGSNNFTGNGVVYKTTNGGVSWFEILNETGMNFNDVCFTSGSDGYLAGTIPMNTGCILKTTTGGLTYITHNSGTTPDNFSLSQNYPNPFNPTTNINYQLPISNYVSLKIYDALGNQVATLVNEKQNAGSYSVDFNASSLPSGIYFYKLVTEKFSETKKMILIK